MKKSIALFIAFLAISIVMKAQEPKPEYMEKVQTLDSTLENLYGVISGEKGEARDWELMRFLFHPDAKLIPAVKNKEGVYQALYMTVDEYITGSEKWLVENGFFEKEVHRVVNEFGNIVQVFSSYESFRSEADEEPFMRGINSIQLLNDGTRWWIINIYWTQESPENPIPKEYLPKKKKR
jgi:hypothetical protein